MTATLSPECPIEAWLAGEPHPCVKPRGHDGAHDFQPADSDDELEDLTAERDALRQQIEDLRAFERDYRARLLAFHEDRARALREGTQ